MSPFSFSLSHSLCFSLFFGLHLQLKLSLFCVLLSLELTQWPRMALCFSSAHRAEWPLFSFFSSMSVSACLTRLSHCPRKWLADLINQDSGTRKPDQVKKLYPHPYYNEILSYPISKTGSVHDKLLWKHSSGEFQVHKAYSLLQQDHQSSCLNLNPNISTPQGV